MCMITTLDHTRISKLIRRNGLDGKLSYLEEKLGLASLVESEVTPSNLVTMNSEVILKDGETGASFELRLVYQITPIYGTQVSVLSPLGNAILGSIENETITYLARDNELKTVTVEKLIFQPESAGQLDL